MNPLISLLRIIRNLKSILLIFALFAGSQVLQAYEPTDAGGGETEPLERKVPDSGSTAVLALAGLALAAGAYRWTRKSKAD